MGEVIQFVSRSERERARLIQEARAIYDSIFPPADPVSKQSDNAAIPSAIPISDRQAPFSGHHRLLRGWKRSCFAGRVKSQFAPLAD